jgi:hypothetical protein
MATVDPSKVYQYPGFRCGKLDLTKLPTDDYLVIEQDSWIRASVEEKVYPEGENSGKVVVKFNDPCVATLCPNDFKVGRELAGATETMLFIQNLIKYKTSETSGKPEFYYIDATDLTETSQRRVDSALVNQYGLYPPAVKPCAIAIPLRSNIRPYGPYATSNFHNSCGGINVEVDKDICPWVFGSVDLMNTAAMIRLQNTELDPLVVGTTGSVTVPCLPQISLGQSMLSQGPVLNGLNVNFSSGGITTSYTFQTFTPKFGSFSRATLDRLKLIAKNRREQLKLLRNNTILNNKIARKRSAVDYRANPILSKQDGIGKAESLSRVFIGEMLDWWKPGGALCTINGEVCEASGDDQSSLRPIRIDREWQTDPGTSTPCINPCNGCSDRSVPMYGPYEEKLSIFDGNRLESSPDFGDGPIVPIRHNSQRTVVGSDTLTKQTLELRWDYEKKAFMSMDGLLGPISLSGDGNLPQYAKYQPRCHRQAPLSPQPPFISCSGDLSITECPDGPPGFTSETCGVPVEVPYYNQKIEQVFQNPVQNPTCCHHHDGSVSGHVIDALGRKRSVDHHMIMNLNPDQDYAEDYRFLGLRGPLVLHAWGYDTWGKPIPNEADIEKDTMEGKFTDANLVDRFMCEWLSRPATWPVGPVDLRFDRDRGVWVAPPQDYKVTVVELLDDLEPLKTARARLINKDLEANKDYGPDLWGHYGEKLEATDDSSSPYIVIAEDRIKASYAKGTRVYAHYDTFRCNYIIFGAVESNNKSSEIIRFKLYDECIPSGTGCDWLAYAGYRDKFLNSHTIGVRINCDGDPVNDDGEKIYAEDIENPQDKSSIFINLYDTVGQHGPAYALYTSFEEWKDKAHNGYAAKIRTAPIPVACCSGEDPSNSGNNPYDICAPNDQNPGPEEPCYSGACSGSESCTLGDVRCGCPDPCLENYEILFLEGYARFVHATLLQDLYPACETDYPEDPYKSECPCGNAAANIDGQLHYGNTPNGIRPKYFTASGETSFRVFDPFYKIEPSDMDDPGKQYKSPFKRLKAGERVLAIFNEKTKKYYIYESEQIDTLIKFALIEDKRSVHQICTEAVIVDNLNRPIKLSDGQLIQNDEELRENKIIVVDTIADKAKRTDTNNFSLFGPALGSDSLQHHYDGEELFHYDRGAYSGVALRPFTGFAKYRDLLCLDPCEDCPDSGCHPSAPSGHDCEFTGPYRKIEVPSYDIITLENFANFVQFEVAEDIIEPHVNYAANYYHYYDGTQPIGRKHESSEYHHDRLINLNVYDIIPEAEEWIKRPSYIVGEIIGEKGWGCHGIGKLDSQKSTTDKLVYNIIDAQTQALFGKFRVLNCEGAEELNYGGQAKNHVICDPKNVRIHWFGGGFEWPEYGRVEGDFLTCNRRGGVVIKNKEEWTGKWYHEPNPSGNNGAVINIGLDEYYIYDAYPIAKVKFGEFTMPSGSGGLCPIPEDCEEFCDYLDGIHPTCCHDTTSPCMGPWLPFSGAQYVAYWNEDSKEYNIINAEEAPILIEGTLANAITCCDGLADVEAYAASSEGFDKEPVKTLLKNVDNPRGFCGFAGDQVIVHRRAVGDCYRYIVLHVGKPCTSGESLDSGNCLLGATEVPHDISGCDYRFFNERIECIPGYSAGEVQQLMHGNAFGLMWEKIQSYQTKVIHGCWDGSQICGIRGYSGFDGADILGSCVPVSNPASCCPENGSVFVPPESGLAWATATYFASASGCEWVITNAECCEDPCFISGCEECIEFIESSGI